jgi:hypothetical protein
MDRRKGTYTPVIFIQVIGDWFGIEIGMRPGYGLNGKSNPGRVGSQLL